MVLVERNTPPNYPSLIRVTVKLVDIGSIAKSQAQTEFPGLAYEAGSRWGCYSAAGQQIPQPPGEQQQLFLPPRVDLVRQPR
jgi:hypothetical protein